MQRDRTYLADILDSARLALQYVGKADWEQFAQDVQLQDSVIRRLEVIGEAARRVSEEGRGRWPGLPWADMVGMRNIMIHDYDAVDLSIVWRTVQNDFPVLIREVGAILETGDAT